MALSEKQPIALTGLGLLVDEKRVNALIMQKSGAKAILRSACNASLFVCFLVLFTLLALSEPIKDMRGLEGYVRRRFDTAAAMPIREVDSVSTFWQYMHVSFVPGLFGNDTRKYYFPGAVVDTFLLIEGANRMFGVARLRMVKVSPDQDCAVETKLGRFFPKCYGPYSPGAEDKMSFGPPDPKTGEPVFVYTPDSKGIQVVGKAAAYPPGGFMQAITASYNDTLNALQLMDDNNFLGPGTRGIIIDFTVYNFNLGLYAVSRILFEVTSSGKWINTFDVDVLLQRHLSPIASRTTDDWLVLLGEILLVLFVLRYLLEEASEFVGFKGWRPYIKMDYFSDAWNLVDWINLLLMISTLGQRVTTWGLSSGVQVYIGDPAKQGLGTFTDLSGVADSMRTIHRCVAFNAVLTWFKAVKYINVVPYITTFSETVAHSQRALFAFAVVFCCTTFGFTLAYYLAFGEHEPDLRTVWQAWVFLFRSFLGDADMTSVYDEAPFTGSLLIIGWVLAMYFVIINVFYAVMLSAHADARQAEDLKGVKRWAQTLDRMNDFWTTVSTSLRLELRFRTCVPGLYSRLVARRKRIQEKERERDEEVSRKERARRPDHESALGPGNPAIGRRHRRALNTVSTEDVEESDNSSEVDLGPLHHKEQITGTMFAETFGTGDPGLPMLQDAPGTTVEPTEEGLALVIQAARYVVNGIVDRTNGARGVLFAEMSESKEVLLKVGSVLEVLGRRARDLEAQQRQLIKHF